MILMKCKSVPAIILLITTLAGCGGNGSEPSPVDNGKDRKEILMHWVENIIIPSYGNFEVKLNAMVGKADVFMATPNTATLVEFRSAWVEAYAEWQKVELFEFGPADKYTLRNFYNIYPADVAGITMNIADVASNLDVPAAYPRQGFPALDYLLNGVGANDTEILAYYTNGTDGAKRLAYVDRITKRMSTRLSNVIAEWSGTYPETFISKTGLDISSSMGLVVNAYVLQYERYIRSGKFGIPSGAMLSSGGATYPEKIEAYYKKDISLLLAKNAHDAAVNFFNGVNVETGVSGPSFKTYLDALGAKDAATGTLLGDIINTQFTTIKSKLDLLLTDLSFEVQTDNQKMIDVYTEMQKLVRMLKVDMTSAMSVTITYTDNDGD
jgi:predicted lipoprotein